MASFEDRLYGIGSLISAGVGAYQANNLYSRTQENEDFLHNTELQIIKDQHKKELAVAKQTYLLSTFTDIEQYCQELNENLLNSSRDAERDMVDQRNQQFQTILLASTIMLTALICVLIQGVLPARASTFLVIIYSISNSGSLICLAMCILLCIEITSRVSKFMYKKSKANIEHLSDAMLHTKEVMQNIRGEKTKNIMSRQISDAITINNDPQSPRYDFSARTNNNTHANEHDPSVSMEYLQESSGSSGQPPLHSGNVTRQTAEIKENEVEDISISDLSNTTVGSAVGLAMLTDHTLSGMIELPSHHKQQTQSQLQSQNSHKHCKYNGQAPFPAKQSSSASIASNSGKHNTANKRIRNLISKITRKTPMKRNNISSSSFEPPPLIQQSNSLQNFEKTRLRHKVTTLLDGDVEKEWSHHEQQIHEYFAARDKINERMELLAISPTTTGIDGADKNMTTGTAGLDGPLRISFEAYWKERCDYLGHWTIILFYIGTSLMLIATMTFMWAQFIYNYHNNKGGVVGIATIGLSLIACWSLAYYLRNYDPTVVQLKRMNEAESSVEQSSLMSKLYALVRGRNNSTTSNSNNTNNTHTATNTTGTGTVSGAKNNTYHEIPPARLPVAGNYTVRNGKAKKKK